MADELTDDTIQTIVDDYKEKTARSNSLAGKHSAVKQLENRYELNVLNVLSY